MDDATRTEHTAALAAAFTPEAWAKVDRAVPADAWVNGVPGRRFRVAFAPETPVLGTTFRLKVGDAEVDAPNFVLPSWYVPGSVGPWDAGGKLNGPHSCTEGGFYVADDDGVVHVVWAMRAGRLAYEAQAADEHSETAQSVSKIEAAAKGVDWEVYHIERFAPTPAPEPEAAPGPAKS